MATARHRHDDRREPDLRQGRSNGSAAGDAGAEGRPLSRSYGTLPARRADRIHQPPSIRHHPDGDERRRPASLQLQRATAAARSRKADGHHRHEDSGTRPNSVHLGTAADRAAKTLMGRNDDPDIITWNAEDARSDV